MCILLYEVYLPTRHSAGRHDAIGHSACPRNISRALCSARFPRRARSREPPRSMFGIRPTRDSPAIEGAASALPPVAASTAPGKMEWAEMMQGAARAELSSRTRGGHMLMSIVQSPPKDRVQGRQSEARQAE
jgi:hypothetical protein